MVETRQQLRKKLETLQQDYNLSVAKLKEIETEINNIEDSLPHVRLVNAYYQQQQEVDILLEQIRALSNRLH